MTSLTPDIYIPTAQRLSGVGVLKEKIDTL